MKKILKYIKRHFKKRLLMKRFIVKKYCMFTNRVEMRLKEIAFNRGSHNKV